jgi:hypothetical protein
MSKFKLAIDNFAEIPEKVVRGGTLNLFNNIIKGTPVDTGRARGNWFTSISAPSKAVSSSTSAQSSVSSLNSTVSVWDVRDSLHITNNLPYITRLEYGYSKQAPSGWVRQAVVRFQDAFDKEARKYK